MPRSNLCDFCQWPLLTNGAATSTLPTWARRRQKGQCRFGVRRSGGDSAVQVLGIFLQGHRGGVRQCLHQSQADDVRRSFFAGLLPADIDHGTLNATRDDGGGIKQRAIPIEGDQVKLAGT